MSCLFEHVYNSTKFNSFVYYFPDSLTHSPVDFSIVLLYLLDLSRVHDCNRVEI